MEREGRSKSKYTICRQNTQGVVTGCGGHGSTRSKHGVHKRNEEFFYQLPDPMSATFSVMLCICEGGTMGGGGGMRWVEIVLVAVADGADG